MNSLVRAAPHLMPIELGEDLAERTIKIYERGLRRGDDTGWIGLDKIWSVSSYGLTLVTGYPSSGKSEWLDALLVNLAQKSNWDFAMFSPENRPTELHVAKLAEKFLWKPFGEGQNERMTRAELDEAMAWVFDHFIWLAPEETDYKTLLASAQPFRRQGRKFGIVLDPWNRLEHNQPVGLTETQYIGKALTEIANWSVDRVLHVFVVAHPKIIDRDKATGKRHIPTPSDISGGANWWNRADNIICVDRDQVAGGPEVQVYMQKVRWKHIGQGGVANLRYDRVTGRYNDAPAGFTAAIVENF